MARKKDSPKPVAHLNAEPAAVQEEPAATVTVYSTPKVCSPPAKPLYTVEELCAASERVFHVKPEVLHGALRCSFGDKYAKRSFSKLQVVEAVLKFVSKEVK